MDFFNTNLQNKNKIYFHDSCRTFIPLEFSNAKRGPFLLPNVEYLPVSATH